MRIIPLKIHSIQEAEDIMRAIGTTSCGVKIMAPKSTHYSFKIEGINSFAANIIKQHMLSLGSDAAISRDALTKKIKTSLVFFGSLYQIEKLIDKLKKQPFGLKDLAHKLDSIVERGLNRRPFLKARDRTLKVTKPIICGIINVTSDSFSGDGILSKAVNNNKGTARLALKKVEQMIKDGAKIVDIGGESSRPYSRPVSESEELKRVMLVLKAIRREFPNVFISIDTYKYRIAKAAAECGADIINDITALKNSPKIADIVKKYKLGCVLMHMKGIPQTMQLKPTYKNVVEDILEFFNRKVKFCMGKGIAKEQLMVDPGIGFGKTTKDNFNILNNLYTLKSLGVPIFLGVSRKSFIGNTLNVGVEKRLIGTIAAVVASYLGGADILRVHDVKETKQALRIAYEIKESCLTS